jgi:hypothetical protein
MLFGAEQTNKDQQAFVPPLEKSGQSQGGDYPRWAAAI